MKKPHLFAALVIAALLSGCQSPRSTYMDGVVFFFSGSAIGFGFGEYAEIAPGGKFDRTSTNDVSSVIGDGRNYTGSSVRIDNSLTPPMNQSTDKKSDEPHHSTD